MKVETSIVLGNEEISVEINAYALQSGLPPTQWLTIEGSDWSIKLIGVTPEVIDQLAAGLSHMGQELRQLILDQIAWKCS